MELVTRVEKGAGAADRLLLLAHGLGANEHDLAALVPYLDADGRFVAVLPRGPDSYGPGYSWYDFGLGGPDPVKFVRSLEALDDLLDAACAEHDLSRDEAILGGFSQGATLTLALGLLKSDRAHPAGILAMSGWLPEIEGIAYEWSAALPPVLMQHGTYDPLIAIERARSTARTLAEHGVPVVFGEYPMEHQVAMESLQQGREWLGSVLAGERPSEPVPTEAEADGPVQSVTSDSFDAEVLQSDLPVIVDFWAPWCAPCRAVAPVVEQIALMREGSYKAVKVDIDACPDIAERYQVQSIPLVALFRNGRLERSSLGAKPRQQLEAELGMIVIP